MSDYERGYTFGFADNYIAVWRYCYYRPEYIKGYLAGKAEIDRLVYDASVN